VSQDDAIADTWTYAAGSSSYTACTRLV